MSSSYLIPVGMDGDKGVYYPLNPALIDILRERLRQNEKWGEQNHIPTYWLGILVEEVGEFSKAVIEDRFTNNGPKTKEEWWDRMREEAVHCAAVSLQIVEFLDRSRPMTNPR